MAICVLLSMSIKPECLTTVENRLIELLPGTRGWEGCFGLDVYRDPNDPCEILFVERWESRERYEEYDSWRVRNGEGPNDMLKNLKTPITRRYLDLTTI